jgi:hypothetical protein
LLTENLHLLLLREIIELSKACFVKASLPLSFLSGTLHSLFPMPLHFFSFLPQSPNI